MFNRVTTPEPRLADAAKPSLPNGLGQPLAQPPIAGIKAPSPFATALQQPAAAMDTPTSVLGQDITISGQQLVLKTRGSLLIAGQIHGDVHGETVTVGETGSVIGTITARTITVQGEVRGALRGANINLNATARVDGDILKQSLTISEGAQFDGSVRRAKDASEVTPDLS